MMTIEQLYISGIISLVGAIGILWTELHNNELRCRKELADQRKEINSMWQTIYKIEKANG